MIYVVMVLLIAPVIGVMLWNGLHGKGYKLVYKAPPLNTTEGVIIRMLGFMYAAVLLCLSFISRYDDSTDEGYRGIGRIISVVLFFAVIFAVNVAIYKKRNK